VKGQAEVMRARHLAERGAGGGRWNRITSEIEILEIGKAKLLNYGEGFQFHAPVKLKFQEKRGENLNRMRMRRM